MWGFIWVPSLLPGDSWADMIEVHEVFQKFDQIIWSFEKPSTPKEPVRWSWNIDHLESRRRYCATPMYWIVLVYHGPLIWRSPPFDSGDRHLLSLRYILGTSWNHAVTAISSNDFQWSSQYHESFCRHDDLDVCFVGCLLKCWSDWKKHIDEQIYIILYADYKYKISQTHLVKKRKLQPPTTSHVFPSIYWNRCLFVSQISYPNIIDSYSSTDKIFIL